MKTQEAWIDPIVNEIHRVREEIVDEAGGDLRSLGEWLMKTQERHGDKLVTHPPQRLKELK